MSSHKHLASVVRGLKTQMCSVDQGKCAAEREKKIFPLHFCFPPQGRVLFGPGGPADPGEPPSPPPPPHTHLVYCKQVCFVGGEGGYRSGGELSLQTGAGSWRAQTSIVLFVSLGLRVLVYHYHHRWTWGEEVYFNSIALANAPLPPPPPPPPTLKSTAVAKVPPPPHTHTTRKGHTDHIFL